MFFQLYSYYFSYCKTSCTEISQRMSGFKIIFCITVVSPFIRNKHPTHTHSLSLSLYIYIYIERERERERERQSMFFL